MPGHWITWTIVALATLGVIVRPTRLPEAVWACSGALILVAAGSITVSEAARGVAKGHDVYLFLLGMMLLAEVAQQQGLFAWLAARAARLARGSPRRLFLLVYLTGTAVTILLSNDATAVVLTPAVAAVVKTMKVQRPLPYLYICAFVANAASFVLPISNPANLVIYGARMPSLLEWLARFGLPSLLAIVATYVMLRFTQRHALQHDIADTVDTTPLSPGGRAAALGLLLAAAALVIASAAQLALGPPTCIASAVTVIAVSLRARSSPWSVVRKISWSVLWLVAGLFVLVAALERTGVVTSLAGAFHGVTQHSEAVGAWTAGGVVALGCNLTNNLPGGLVMASVIGPGDSHTIIGAVLIGIDLGPNLSITGSLATVLWLQALRRAQLDVSAWTFLRLGVVVMIPALVLALASLLLVSRL